MIVGIYTGEYTPNTGRAEDLLVAMDLNNYKESYIEYYLYQPGVVKKNDATHVAATTPKTYL